MTSTYTLGPEQIDGRREVVETHVDGSGNVHEARYLADDGTDYAAVMTARAAAIEAKLAAGETRNAVKAGLDAQRGTGTYDTVKECCVEIGVELVQLDGITIDVRTEAPVTPEDTELGAVYAATGGDWPALKAAIKAMGVSTVTLSIKRKITL